MVHKDYCHVYINYSMKRLKKSAEIVCDSLTAFDGSLEKSQKQTGVRDSVGLGVTQDRRRRNHEGIMERRFHDTSYLFVFR